MSIATELMLQKPVFNAFPKIYHIGDRSISEIFDGPVEVTEKVDGSQIRFKKENGEIIVASKGRTISQPDKLFKPAFDYIHSIKDKIREGIGYYGETLATPKHNTMAYGRVPKNHIALFGISFNNTWLSYSVIEEEAKNIDVDIVPLLCHNIIHNVEELLSFLDRESFLGNEKIEGFVVKNYLKYSSNPFSSECFGKYVREGFKERNGAKQRQEKKDNGIEGLVEELRTEARWNKAIQHLRDDAQLKGTPSDIGPLIAECQKDLEDEEKEYIKDRLYTIFKRSIGSGVIKGLPEYYKKKLIEGAF